MGDKLPNRRNEESSEQQQAISGLEELISALAFEPASPPKPRSKDEPEAEAAAEENKMMGLLGPRQRPAFMQGRDTRSLQNQRKLREEKVVVAAALSEKKWTWNQLTYPFRPMALFVSIPIVVVFQFTTLCERWFLSKKLTLTITVIVLFLSRPSSSSSSGGSSSHHSPAAGTISPSSKKSLLAVDPGKILERMSKHGGLILPPSVERDLQVFHRVSDADVASLDVFNRELEVKNFTLSPSSSSRKSKERQPAALRIRRVLLQWDSYREPCLDILVEGVDVMVEYTDMLLRRSNWDELKDEGFPPPMEDDSKAKDDEKYDDDPVFVRIGSIDLKGKIRFNIRSRPLDRQLIKPVVFNFATVDDLFERIKRASADAKKTTGRRGCTPEDLDGIIGQYFKDKIRELLKTPPPVVLAMAADAMRDDGPEAADEL